MHVSLHVHTYTCIQSYDAYTNVGINFVLVLKYCMYVNVHYILMVKFSWYFVCLR